MGRLSVAVHPSVSPRLCWGFLHFRSIRYRTAFPDSSQDVRQRIRHRVHRCRCLRDHPHGGRSDQEGRVSFGFGLPINKCPGAIILVLCVALSDETLCGAMTHGRRMGPEMNNRRRYRIAKSIISTSAVRMWIRAYMRGQNEIRFIRSGGETQFKMRRLPPGSKNNSKSCW